MIYNVIGLMSGTSLDGLDITYCTFELKQHWEGKIKAVKTIHYPKEWKDILQSAHNLNPKHIESLHKELGMYYGDCVKEFVEEFQVIPDFISSHGHTILHEPKKGITKQIGSGYEIARKTGFTVVNDFRSSDVNLGGQGAPLVPIGDKILFGEFEFCLNLGGFANISFDEADLRIAFDVCPCNIPLNYLANKMGFEYDDQGKIAREGDLDNSLLSELNALSYYQKSQPKSLGLEWYLDFFDPVLTSYKISIPNKLATVANHIVQQITNTLSGKNGKVLVTGGGAYNTYLIELLKSHTSVEVVIPTEELINYKEAFIFAFLGVLRLRNEINVLSSVTGAARDHCSGVLHHA